MFNISSLNKGQTLFEYPNSFYFSFLLLFIFLLSPNSYQEFWFILFVRDIYTHNAETASVDSFLGQSLRISFLFYISSLHIRVFVFCVNWVIHHIIRTQLKFKLRTKRVVKVKDSDHEFLRVTIAAKRVRYDETFWLTSFSIK